MPVIKSNKSINPRTDNQNVLLKWKKKYLNVNFVKSLIFDPVQLPIVSVCILLAELILNIFIIQKVNYTEIDWIAYMQECEGFLNGTTNYAELKGDTGPLVYPAGFVYIYTFFYFITSRGQNIILAQYIFVLIYLLQMAFVLRIYIKSRKVPPYVLILTTFTSYRIHSIYVLRLFNDPIAVLFFYIALNAFMDSRFTLGSVFFSLGVSVKMNILLFAPAILLFYIVVLGYKKSVIQLSICAIIQLILGAPFLLTYPIEYIKGSFNLGRIFEHKWTVNYRFLDRSTFESPLFHVSLLILHIFLLALFTKPFFKYLENYCRLRVLEKQFKPQIQAENRKKKAGDEKLKVKLEEKKKNDEKMTPDQKKFLKSFEKGLQKMAGTTEKPGVPVTEDVIEEKTFYSINFDQSLQLMLLPIFMANFIGIVCSRSLHYQFYVWYFHSLPYLAWCTGYQTSLKLLLLFLIELSWNTYPSTVISSLLLHVCHGVILFGIMKKLFTGIELSKKVQEQDKEQ